jgi:lipoate-protein ligase A
MIWQPEQTMVVIGKGSHPEQELVWQNVAADGVPVLRRESGGCAVVISPDMLAISCLVEHPDGHGSHEYFRRFNQMIINALESLGVSRLRMDGISDIVLGDRKVAGSSIYRNKDILLFHAILNLRGPVDIFERYLRFPPRQPDYRQGRAHGDFVTSLQAQGYSIDARSFEAALRAEWLMDFT